jgi:hypothetical protein
MTCGLAVELLLSTAGGRLKHTNEAWWALSHLISMRGCCDQRLLPPVMGGLISNVWIQLRGEACSQTSILLAQPSQKKRLRSATLA